MCDGQHAIVNIDLLGMPVSEFDKSLRREIAHADKPVIYVRELHQ